MNLHIQQMTASVGLIEALGGGWDNTQLPGVPQMSSKATPATKTAAAVPSDAAVSSNGAKQ